MVQGCFYQGFLSSMSPQRRHDGSASMSAEAMTTCPALVKDTPSPWSPMDPVTPRWDSSCSLARTVFANPEGLEKPGGFRFSETLNLRPSRLPVHRAHSRTLASAVVVHGLEVLKWNRPVCGKEWRDHDMSMSERENCLTPTRRASDPHFIDWDLATRATHPSLPLVTEISIPRKSRRGVPMTLARYLHRLMLAWMSDLSLQSIILQKHVPMPCDDAWSEQLQAVC
mmetsp:Transcript_4852/g.10695  ORF Transcript_4852/g.10695 Transcript_4852/m.10695 type:complete len:226 (+) Transcript_4852:870-1547(+)